MVGVDDENWQSGDLGFGISKRPTAPATGNNEWPGPMKNRIQEGVFGTMTGCPEETKSVVQPLVLARVVVAGGSEVRSGTRWRERKLREMCRWRKDASRGRGSATFEVDVAVGLARLVIRCLGNLLQGLFHRPEVCGLWVAGRHDRWASSSFISGAYAGVECLRFVAGARTMSPPQLHSTGRCNCLHHTTLVLSCRLFLSKSRSQVAEDGRCGFRRC
jgi:hypothetical protein